MSHGWVVIKITVLSFKRGREREGGGGRREGDV